MKRLGVVLLVLLAAGAAWIGRDGLRQFGPLAGDQSSYHAAFRAHQDAEAAAWTAIGDMASTQKRFYDSFHRLAIADRRFADSLVVIASSDSVRREAEALRASLLDSARLDEIFAKGPSLSDVLGRIAQDLVEQHRLEGQLRKALNL